MRRPRSGAAASGEMAAAAAANVNVKPASREELEARASHGAAAQRASADRRGRGGVDRRAARARAIGGVVGTAVERAASGHIRTGTAAIWTGTSEAGCYRSRLWVRKLYRIM